jgi:hypothetical protein
MHPGARMHPKFEAGPYQKDKAASLFCIADNTTRRAMLQHAERILQVPVQAPEPPECATAEEAPVALGAPSAPGGSEAPAACLLLWRLDLPPRTILYTPTRAPADLLTPTAHERKKLIVNTKPDRHNRGFMGIQVVQGTPGIEAVREAVRREAAARVRGQLAERIDGHVNTTMAEAAICLACVPPDIICYTPVAQETPWQFDSIDARYAEYQGGREPEDEASFRYRDWVAMYTGEEGTQQARLGAHCLPCTPLHRHQVQWKRADGSVQLLDGACTIPWDPVPLKGETLEEAVRFKYIHHLVALPAPAGAHPVTRGNTEMYVAGPTAAVVYATRAVASGAASLHMLSFNIKKE